MGPRIVSWWVEAGNPREGRAEGFEDAISTLQRDHCPLAQIH